MQNLRFLEHDENSLIFIAENGAKFRVESSEENLAAFRSAIKNRRGSDRRVSPREIQARLRAGSSSKEVAESLDLELSDVERHEGPILAERKFILNSSHAVEVRTNDHRGDEPQTFGEVIADRIAKLTENTPEWSVWRDEEGWMVQVSFLVAQTEHEAVWSFDHKKNHLTPITADAVNLSKQESVGEKLIPTLRAVDDPDRSSQFDSASFKPEDLVFATPDTQDEGESDTDTDTDTGADPEPSPHDITFHPPKQFEQDGELDEFARRQKIEERAISTSADDSDLQGETADLLDALRKRRSQRESFVVDVEDHDPIILSDPEPSPMLHTMPLQTVDIDLPTGNEFPETDEVDPLPQVKNKKGRTSVPSWDEILFGQRSEDDE